MYSFAELIKKIRKESGLTQAELAKILSISKILIVKIETGKKDASKKFIIKLAEKLDVHPSSITPFLFPHNPKEENLSRIEGKLIYMGEKMQDYLIKKRAKNLQKYVNKK